MSSNLETSAQKEYTYGEGGIIQGGYSPAQKEGKN